MELLPAKKTTKWYQKRYGLICGLLIAAVTMWGVFTTWATYDQWFDPGDTATYYVLSREIAQGKVIYKDFVQFKTPASYFMEAASIKLFGDSEKSVFIGVGIEIRVLYALVFMTSVYLLFQRTRNPLFCVCAAFAIFYLLPITGLRAGFAFLSLCCYIVSFEYLGRARSRWLLAAGVAAGVAFMFGQDMLLVAAVTIAAGEAFEWHRTQSIQRWKYLIGGMFIGAAPLLLYVMIFSHVKTFLYYITYYGLVLQPKYMDLPFPVLSWNTILSYLPFLLYFCCFLELISDTRSTKREALLLSFGIVRLVTALGRSDLGHLFFSIPELFVIVPFFVLRIPTMRTSGARLRRTAPFAAAMALILTLAITVSSLILLLVPFVALFALRRLLAVRQPARLAPASLRMNAYAAVASLFVLLTFLLYPYFISNAHAIKGGAVLGTGPVNINGLKTDPVTYAEVQGVTQAVKRRHPTTIFSFPIQPYYYSLAPNTATRFISFEPETTLGEQNQAIEDLRQSRPQVVVFDAVQAEGQSDNVWKISRYLFSHYTVSDYVVHRNILWVMVPSPSTSRSYPLLFQLKKDNPDTTAMGLQHHDEGIDNAILQPGKTLRFTVPATPRSMLDIDVLVRKDIQQAGTANCGKVTIKSGAAPAHSTNICSGQAHDEIDIDPAKTATIMLENDSSRPIVWKDPSIVSTRN